MNSGIGCEYSVYYFVFISLFAEACCLFYMFVTRLSNVKWLNKNPLL